ncbi:MAG: PEP-CTERM sorting domain-containing protein, partial [bacterium]|nr:PEP-CTERM sorting domain-containing protein [bacterium]
YGVTDPGRITGGNPSGKVGAESIYLGGQTDPALTFLTFNPSASSMVAGNTYTLQLEFNLGTNATSNILGFGELDMGLFTYRTNITVIAVPEPSTYAAILGVVALGGVMIRRRHAVRAG